MISISDFGEANGRRARLFTLSNGLISASVTDFGASIADVSAFDKNGGTVHAVLGYGSAEGYLHGGASLGATVGRYAGRIGGASFVLGGRRYFLSKNDGENHLHGGFGSRFFEAEAGDGAVVMSLFSPDGDEGFPGALTLTVTYSLNGSALRVVWRAVSRADTVINITNHAYFNLAGGGTVHGHLLKVYADEYAEPGPGLIPTGRILPVHGTALDFSKPAPLKKAIEAPELSVTRGLDHSFILKGSGMRTAAELYCPETGVRLVCRTTQPTVHVYTAGFLGNEKEPPARDGMIPVRHGGVCLETQRLPDSPNRPEFGSALLRAGEEYSETTEYEFGLKDA